MDTFLGGGGGGGVEEYLSLRPKVQDIKILPLISRHVRETGAINKTTAPSMTNVHHSGFRSLLNLWLAHRTIPGSPWLEANNNHIFLSRRFHKPIFFRLNFPRMRLPQEADDQSQETNLTSWCHPTGTAFVLCEKGSLKIDRTVKMSKWYRIAMCISHYAQSWF